MTDEKIIEMLRKMQQELDDGLSMPKNDFNLPDKVQSLLRVMSILVLTLIDNFTEKEEPKR